MAISKRKIAAILLLAMVVGCGKSNVETTSHASATAPAKSAQPVVLLNVSYDPTRELWKQINEQFAPTWKKRTGQDVSIRMSHGGSGSQARSIIDGLEADVATLAMWTDTEQIRKAGLIEGGWDERLPNGALPYSSTIVFVVRKGNSKEIKDWPDLVKQGVKIITPNPKTSGNGKLSFIAAWGSVVLRGGSDQDAREFATQLYKRVPVLDSGARGSTTTFAQKGLGDVHLTWENEAHLEVAEAKGALELVYPKISIRAEPRVALIDSNVDRKGTREVAQAYLEYLYTDDAQEIIAKNHYRPSSAEVLARHRDSLPSLELFSIKKLGGNWEEVEKRFFGDGGVFDEVQAEAAK
jgi:sulfate transport system substrate-binding protein